ncbi:MAG TPA: diguanylate cyclase [Planctomycetota bacterium]|jgi:diguanylate cyclase (GGDEF)-like protein|nr:diguanylate cyclase [Planctomycetota bacterium]
MEGDSDDTLTGGGSGRAFDELRLAENLPSPPGLGLSLLGLARDDHASNAGIVEYIRADAVLTGRLLKLANASRPAGVPPATNAVAAAALVRIEALRELALGFRLVSRQPGDACEGFDHRHYWLLSLATAAAAEALALQFHASDPEESFTIGLSSRVGMLAMATVHPAAFAEVLRESRDGGTNDLALAEVRALRIDHWQVAAEMMTDWGMPESLRQPLVALSRDAFRARRDDAETIRGSSLLNMALEMADAIVASETGHAPGAAAPSSKAIDADSKRPIGSDAVSLARAAAVRRWRELVELCGLNLRPESTSVPSKSASGRPSAGASAAANSSVGAGAIADASSSVGAGAGASLSVGARAGASWNAGAHADPSSAAAPASVASRIASPEPGEPSAASKAGEIGSASNPGDANSAIQRGDASSANQPGDAISVGKPGEASSTGKPVEVSSTGNTADVSSASKPGTRVLVVDDEPSARHLISLHLRRAGFEVIQAVDGESGLRAVISDAPEIVITDWLMPGMSGLELCKALRKSEIGKKLYLLLVTAREEEDSIVEGFEAGANDYLTKPFNPRILLARVRAGRRMVELQHQVELDKRVDKKRVADMAKLARELRNAATRDVLTGLPNRRSAMTQLQEFWVAAERYGRPLSVAMIDIDHFKQVNDQHGHQVGDAVLRNVANVLRAKTRRSDVVCRIGGEEFLLISVNGDLTGTRVGAERLRASVEATTITCPGFEGQITVSLGVAERTPTMKSIDDLLLAADRAVYMAKEQGRNRVCLSVPPGARAA